MTLQFWYLEVFRHSHTLKTLFISQGFRLDITPYVPSQLSGYNWLLPDTSCHTYSGKEGKEKKCGGTSSRPDEPDGKGEGWNKDFELEEVDNNLGGGATININYIYSSNNIRYIAQRVSEVFYGAKHSEAPLRFQETPGAIYLEGYI